MPNPLRLTLILSGTISLLAAFFYFHQSSDPTFQSTISSYIPFRKHASDDQPWSFDPTRDGRKYGLSPLQCDAAFPGLLSEISDTATRRQTRGNITRQDLDVYAQQPGTMRIMIYDGNVYVVDDNRMDMEWIQPRGLGTLHSIHRAILALNDPETLPNIEFVMTLGDSIPRITSEAPPPAEVADLIHANIPMWSYSRREEDDNVWLMPDFGWWDWGMMSTPDSVGRKSEEVERDLPFEKKIPKALWRGAVWTDVSVRQPLVDVAKDKEWADVRGLLWGSETFDQDFVRPEDHCRYMFLVYAEGIAYSGRLKYLQTCQSVLISHPLKWITPWQRLLRSSGQDQNYVEVLPGFSNLEIVVTELIRNPKRAQEIADKNVKTFRDHYNTPAAEACYWRKLFSEWSKVSEPPQFYEDGHEEIQESGTNSRKWRGTPWEDYALDRRRHH